MSEYDYGRDSDIDEYVRCGGCGDELLAGEDCESCRDAFERDQIEWEESEAECDRCSTPVQRGEMEFGDFGGTTEPQWFCWECVSEVGQGGDE